MKKVISLFVAIALVLSMSVCAFAATEKPTGTPADGAALGAYYAEILNAGEVDAATVAAAIVADYQDGTIDETTAQAFVDALFANADSTDSATAVIQQVIVGLDSLGIAIPNIQLPGTNPEGSTPDISIPDISIPEITLPEDDGADEGGSFFDTIFGILGDLAGSLLGGGDSGDGSGDGAGDGDDGLGFGDDETTTNGSDSQVTNTGDTSVVAVATVALVAGAALVLTRKKSDDAE